MSNQGELQCKMVRNPMSCDKIGCPEKIRQDVKITVPKITSTFCKGREVIKGGHTFSTLDAPGAFHDLELCFLETLEVRRG